ncbi:MAG: hypothetical protein HFI63_08785 [Lachnospiraceae bacterium]|nr:hypothetical protein [Lachnospiraceae bacterium]
MKSVYEMTETELRNYQRQKELEVSMPPGKKRDLVIKTVLKPLLKAASFKTKRTDWWKELADGWLFVHLHNSMHNCSVTGCSFRFHFSVSESAKLRDELSKQWIYNQSQELLQRDFLPHAGLLSPFHKADMYQIDGYQNYLPKDDPVDQILTQIRSDFESHILPALAQIHATADWKNLYEKQKSLSVNRENSILRYYHQACMGISPDLLRRCQKQHDLSDEDVLSRLDWLEQIQKYSSWPDRDIKSVILESIRLSV